MSELMLAIDNAQPGEILLGLLIVLVLAMVWRVRGAGR